MTEELHTLTEKDWPECTCGLKWRRKNYEQYLDHALESLRTRILELANEMAHEQWLRQQDEELIGILLARVEHDKRELGGPYPIPEVRRESRQGPESPLPL